MSGKILYVTCQRKFYGLGCRWCSLRFVCDRDGFVPKGQSHPSLEGVTKKSDCLQPEPVGGGGDSETTLVSSTTEDQG